ncbi:MAG: UDP-N-acetylmuramoyl-tripeptide--D-alanyl-D-alanine ligase [Patescibacteria group bacterium]|nr:UDP-N-acetylmuramoyl-tripeptide--D-alanyl-D-alanine ligase [Patescibacteria group bacterium]
MRPIVRSILVALLTMEARAVVRKYRPSIIAVTGSVGKTSTKDAIYAALSSYASVRKSDKSFNSEIGIPLTILGRPNAWENPLRWIQNLLDGLALILFRMPYPQWLILEIGADRPGDIRKVAAWLPVDIAVITRLPEIPVHVEYFETPEEVVEEKASLISALKPSGTLILYGDDARVRELSSRALEARTITFGFSEHATIRGTRVEFIYSEGKPAGMRANISAEGHSAEARVSGTVGSHAFLPLLAAVAVAASLDMPLGKAITSLEENYRPAPGRMHILSGLRGSTVIDDTYNASPAATVAALETLASLNIPGRKIAALGDMLELGRFSVDEHRKLGALAAESVDLLITVGFRARDIAQAALDGGLTEKNIFQCEDSDEVGEMLSPLLSDGDCVLLKGSQSIRMEHAVESIMAYPEEAQKLLVRQEEEWQRR